MNVPRSGLESRRHGFSLTEMAIVLSVGGIILAGVWTAINAVTERGRINSAQTQITQLVAGIRSMTTGAGGIADTGATDLMQNFALGKVIPVFMIRSPAGNCANTGAVCADGPWGPNAPDDSTVDANGTLQICGWDAASWGCGTNAAAKSQLFAITIEGLSKSACLKLSTSITGAAGPAGLMDAVINGTSILHLGAGHPLPVSTADASARCANANLGNAISLVYRVRAPSS